MDPNNANPNTTPPNDDVSPEVPVTPETPAPEATPSTESTPASEPAFTSEEPVTPVSEPAPVADPAPANPFAQPETSEPTTPVQETPATFTAGAPVSPNEPKGSKKTILIASIVAGAVLLAVAGVVAYMFLSSVSKEDYRDAAVQFNDVSSATASLNSDVRILSSSTSSSDERFEESVKEVEASLATIKTENDELAKQKAVRVGEGAELYGTFNDKMKSYLAYADELVVSVKNLRPAMVVCDNVSEAEDATARIAALKACATALGNVSDVPNAEFKAYIGELKGAYEEFASIYEGVAGITSPYGAQAEEYKALRERMTAVQTKISDATKKFSADLKARDEALSMKESTEALADFLNEKQK